MFAKLFDEKKTKDEYQNKFYNHLKSDLNPKIIHIGKWCGSGMIAKLANLRYI